MSLKILESERSSEQQVVVERCINDTTGDMPLRIPEVSRQLARVVGWRECL